MNELATKHAALASRFQALAEAVQDWDAPTPVAEWRARDIVGHLSTWLPEMAAGYGIDLPKVTGDDPVRVWREHSANVQALLEDDAVTNRVVQTSAGDQTIAQVLDNFYLADIFMHQWDLAKASGQSVGWNPEVATSIVEGMTPMRDMLAESGQFGTPVVLDESHRPEERLAALIGRDPAWTAG